MGRKYLAGNAGWYDPTNSSYSTYKYLRGDNQWVKSDGAHKFLDATGSWSSPMPNKMPTSLYDPNDVKAAAENALFDPEAVWKALGGRYTDAISFGADYGAHRFQLVGVKKETAYTGGMAGLVFMAERWANKSTKMRSSSSNSGGYANCDTVLNMLRDIYNNMNANWRTLVKAVNIRYSTSTTAVNTLTNQLIFLPSMWNLGGYNSSFCAKEGECWDYFIGTPSDAADEKRLKHAVNLSSSTITANPISYWCRSGNFARNYQFARVMGSGTNAGYFSGSDALGTNNIVPAFCV